MLRYGEQSYASSLHQTGYWESCKVDACANPYLSVAAYIVAGVLGLASGEELTTKDSGFILGEAAHAELARYNITEKLPGSMTEAIQACKDDETSREREFGGVFMDRLINQRT
jgi:glutamine synthetase